MVLISATASSCRPVSSRHLDRHVPHAICIRRCVQRIVQGTVANSRRHITHEVLAALLVVLLSEDAAKALALDGALPMDRMILSICNKQLLLQAWTRRHASSGEA